MSDENLQIVSEKPDVILEGPDEVEDDEDKAVRITDFVRGSRGYPFALLLAFVIGLLLGWMVLGWKIWPVKWVDTDPWDLRPEHQRRFVTLVARDYSRTGDIFRARRALAGWDNDALAELLTQMEAETNNLKERQQLVALREVLGLSGTSGVPSDPKR